MRLIMRILPAMLWLHLGVVVSSSTPTIDTPSPLPTFCGDIVNSQEFIFDASLVHNCLTSVPFHPDVATRLIQDLNDTLQFQSTLAYLKNPPVTYQQPAVDLIAGLNQLHDAIQHGVFQNEYDFEIALYYLLNAAHDDHLQFSGGALDPFNYAAPFDIVSVSLDGIQLPKVYITDDLFAFANKTHGPTWQPSAIKAINGIDVNDYLQDFAATNSYGKLDPHAQWNMLMRSAALDLQRYREVFSGGGRVYPGPTISVTFENGSNIGPLPWKAVYHSPGDTGPLDTGGDFYNFFVLGHLPASYDEDHSKPLPSPTSTPTLPAQRTETAYPHVTNAGMTVTGYFLRVSSIAVINIPSFLYWDDDPEHFSNIVKSFLRRSRAAGMKSIIIDLQQNTGGQVMLAIETFKLFFPDAEPIIASRRRAHPMANTLGSTINSHWTDRDVLDENYYALSTNEWVVSDRLDAETGRNFTSWEDYYGPTYSYHDHFTNLEMYDLNNPIFDVEAGGPVVDGWGESQSPPHYHPENITILTDGICSSACALFMELMKHQKGVRTVVVGGQPVYSPMQAAGGTRGAASYAEYNLRKDKALTRSLDESTSNVLQDRPNDFWTSYASVNLRDQIRINDTDAIPAQFHDDPADCRIFYTPETFYNATQLWKYAARASWDNPGLCVSRATMAAEQQQQPPPFHAPHKNGSNFDISEFINKLGGYHNVSKDHSNDILDADGPLPPKEGKPCTYHSDCRGLKCVKTSACDIETGTTGYRFQCVRTCTLGYLVRPHVPCQPEPLAVTHVEPSLQYNTGYCPPWNQQDCFRRVRKFHKANFPEYSDESDEDEDFGEGNGSGHGSGNGGDKYGDSFDYGNH